MGSTRRRAGFPGAGRPRPWAATPGDRRARPGRFPGPRSARLVRLRGHLASALSAGLRHRDREALAYCRRAAWGPCPPPWQPCVGELRALASGHGAELGRIGLDVVVRGGSPARALNWMERSRAAALLAVEPAGFGEIRADLACARSRSGRRTCRRGRRARIHGSGRAGQLTVEQVALEDRIRQTTWRAERRPERPRTRPSVHSVTASRAGAGCLRAARRTWWR